MSCGGETTNCCAGNNKYRKVIKDIDELLDPLLAEYAYLYRLPDGSIWALNEQQSGYDQVNGASVLRVEDTDSIDLSYEDNVLTADLNADKLKEIITPMLPTFSVDGFDKTTLVSIEVITNET